MPSDGFEIFLRIPNFFFTSVGIDVNANDVIDWKKMRFLQILYYFGLVNMNAHVCGELIVSTMFFRDGDLVLAVMTLSYVGFVFMGTFKMLYVRGKQQELAEYLNELCEIFPKGTANIEFYEMRRYLRKCRHVTIGFATLFMALIWTYNLFAWFQYLIVDKWLQRQDIGKQLPYNIYVPWQWQEHWSYYVLYASQNIAGYTAAAAQVANDLLLCATATQVIMHYDYIAKKIETFEPIENKYQLNEIKNKNLQFIRDLIGFHQRILNLSDQMNSIFGVPLLLNFMTSCFVICFVGFQMSIGFSAEMMFKLCLYLIASTAQVCLICYYGEELQNSSENIALAVYQHHWQNADLVYKKMLITMVQRSQQAAKLKATSVLDVTLCTMTDISYKFFAVLRTMYSE